MANLSDADVTISGEKVGKELLEYIRATQKTHTDYAIIYDEFDDDVVDEEGNIDLHSSSSGRWAYENNLGGYFDPLRVKEWLGVGSDYSWVGSKEQQEAYTVQANTQYNAYMKLVQAIKKKGGSVTIDYTDSDIAMCWMSEGSATLQEVDGEVEYTHSSQNIEWTIANYAQQQYEDEEWALEYMYGDEVADAYEKAENKGSSVDDWYNNIYKEA